MKNNKQRTPERSSHFLQVKGLWDVWHAIGRIVEPIIPTGSPNPENDHYRVAGVAQDKTLDWLVILQAVNREDNLLVPLGTYPSLFWEVQP